MTAHPDTEGSDAAETNAELIDQTTTRKKRCIGKRINKAESMLVFRYSIFLYLQTLAVTQAKLALPRVLRGGLTSVCYDLLEIIDCD